MRSHWRNTLSKRIRYQRRVTLARPMSAADDVRRAKALREASLVRRAIRGTHSGTNGVLGSLAALDALRRGAVSEIFLSRRFIESDPASAAAASRLAASRGARVTMVTGLAEFELDLIGCGIAALLKRAPRPA